MPLVPTDPSPPKYTSSLFLILGLGLLLVLWVGGVTRLKGAGLSITTWDIVSGILPPLTPEAWDHTFRLYQASPEYLHLNWGMRLAEFKDIYGWEYAHRLLARLLGLISCLGIWKAWRHPSLRRVFLLLFLLISVQGIFGWIMVKSGLKENPHVSPYLLSLHLLWAMGILSLITHFFWKTARISLSNPHFAQKGFFYPFTTFLILTILWGAWVAGFKAGFLYPTFPLMGTHLLPPEIWTVPLSQWVGDPTCLITTHRLLAYSTFGMGLFLSTGLSSTWKWSLRLLLTLQLILGAWMSWSGVHWIPASLHQLNAAFLIVWIVSLNHSSNKK